MTGLGKSPWVWVRRRATRSRWYGLDEALVVPDHVARGDAVATLQRSREPERRSQLTAVAHHLGVALADVLDADRRVVQADGVPAHDGRPHEPVDRAVAVDHEVRADARQLVQLLVRLVAGEQVEDGRERGRGGVVLDDHLRVAEPPVVEAVVALRVVGHVGAPLGAVRDRLRRPRAAARRRARVTAPRSRARGCPPPAALRPAAPRRTRCRRGRSGSARTPPCRGSAEGPSAAGRCGRSTGARASGRPCSSRPCGAPGGTRSRRAAARAR